MGFFSNLKSASVFKTGKKHADDGNFEKALVYFNDAARLSTDRKQLYAYRMWYYLTKALSCYKSGNLEDARSSLYSGFGERMNLEEECVKTGSTIYFSVCNRHLQSFMGRYHEYFEIINR